MSNRQLSPAVEVMSEPREPVDLKILKLAKAIIADDRDWCKGAEREIDMSGHDSFCMIGAINAASVFEDEEHWFGVTDNNAGVRVEIAVGTYIDSFNDDPSTTHADVMAAFDLAIEQATKDWLAAK